MYVYTYYVILECSFFCNISVSFLCVFFRPSQNCIDIFKKPALNFHYFNILVGNGFDQLH